MHNSLFAASPPFSLHMLITCTILGITYTISSIIICPISSFSISVISSAITCASSSIVTCTISSYYMYHFWCNPLPFLASLYLVITCTTSSAITCTISSIITCTTMYLPSIARIALSSRLRSSNRLSRFSSFSLRVKKFG